MGKDSQKDLAKDFIPSDFTEYQSWSKEVWLLKSLYKVKMLTSDFNSMYFLDYQIFWNHNPLRISTSNKVGSNEKYEFHLLRFLRMVNLLSLLITTFQSQPLYTNAM